MIEAAAGGRLPDWAVAAPARRAHMARVAELMDRWAADLAVPPAERVRWLAVAWLHDALRDEDPATLRATLARPLSRPDSPLHDAEFHDWPDPLLHGPAAAARLEADGVADGSLLRAVAFHSVGVPGLDRLGRTLYLADFLEPGRSFEPVRRAALRARMPGAMDDVLAGVVGARLLHLIGQRRRVRPETLAFWNSLADRP